MFVELPLQDVGAPNVVEWLVVELSFGWTAWVPAVIVTVVMVVVVFAVQTEDEVPEEAPVRTRRAATFGLARWVGATGGLFGVILVMSAWMTAGYEQGVARSHATVDRALAARADAYAARQAEEARLRTAVDAKYAVRWFPSTNVAAARKGDVSVIGSLNGTAAKCMLRLLEQDEPVVFCAAGQEGDRVRR